MAQEAMNLEEPQCEICKKERSVGVASSAFAPVSFAIGRECLLKKAESQSVVEYLLETNGGPEGCNAYFLDETQVYFEGKYETVREFAKRGTWKEKQG